MGATFLALNWPNSQGWTEEWLFLADHRSK